MTRSLDWARLLERELGAENSFPISVFSIANGILLFLFISLLDRFNKPMEIGITTMLCNLGSIAVEVAISISIRVLSRVAMSLLDSCNVLGGYCIYHAPHRNPLEVPVVHDQWGGIVAACLRLVQQPFNWALHNIKNHHGDLKKLHRIGLFMPSPMRHLIRRPGL